MRRGAGLVAALGDKVLGPFDFAWLLERTADFGGEAAPWHGAGALPADFRSDPPPPPLQLMVPEMMSLEETEALGKAILAENAVRALFFTDRAGYLRGARRATQQGHALCEAIARLMRHRQPLVTLTHNSTSVAFERRLLENGAKAWTDRQLSYMNIPTELERAVFFAGPHTTGGGELVLSSPQEGFAYVWCEAKAEFDGGVPNLGWDALGSSMTFSGCRVMKIYRKLMSTGSSVVIPVRYPWVGGVAFQARREDGDGSEDMSLQGTFSARRSSMSCATSLSARRASVGKLPPAEISPTFRKRHKQSVLRNRRISPAERILELPPPAGSPRAAFPSALSQQLRPEPVMQGTWRVCMQGGRKQQLKYEEVAAKFSHAGEASQWPAGARLVQACFWEGQKGVHTDMVYHYDALRKECDGTHEGTSRNIVNHFERYSFLDSVADWNRVSSAPVLVSQHLSYHCGLELLSGDFEFVRDTFGQLWLVDARNLLLIAGIRNQGGGGGVRDEVSSGQDPPKQTLPRYLSEEALRNLPVPEDTGIKCHRMAELMHEHYKTMKVHSGMEDMLRKTDEVVEISIPMFEGTDRRAFARTFGAAACGTRGPADGGGTNSGIPAALGLRKLPAAPRQQGIIGRGGFVRLPPRPASTLAGGGGGGGGGGGAAAAHAPHAAAAAASAAAAAPRATLVAAAAPRVSAWMPLLGGTHPPPPPPPRSRGGGGGGGCGGAAMETAASPRPCSRGGGGGAAAASETAASARPHSRGGVAASAVEAVAPSPRPPPRPRSGLGEPAGSPRSGSPQRRAGAPSAAGREAGGGGRAAPRDGSPPRPAGSARQTLSLRRARTRSMVARAPILRRATTRVLRCGADGEDAAATEEQAATIEIVLPDSAQKLLAHSGPGLRPDGPTLDMIGPLPTRTPGLGLLARRQAARPVVRLVEVPAEAASAVLPAAATSSLQRGPQA